jgi:hypothetical protein
MGRVMCSFRIDGELLARVDGVAGRGGRSGFICGAIEAALRADDGGSSLSPSGSSSDVLSDLPMKEVSGSHRYDGSRSALPSASWKPAPEAEFLAALGDGVKTSAEIARGLGWTDGLVRRVEHRLLSSGRISYEGGRGWRRC